MKIAILITCFNRLDKTSSCLNDILAQEIYSNVLLDVFIVDGGSSDGTPEVIAQAFPDVHIEVHSGLYWAGGMRAAWKMANAKDKYDYYWLINDDTHLYNFCLRDLLAADEYAIKHYGKQGIYVGSTKNPVTQSLSYGGRVLLRPEKPNSQWIEPDGHTYKECQLGNANILLVSRAVYESIGGFYEGYTHGIADYDYTMRACRAGFPVLVLPNYEGECEDDHGDNWMPQSTSLKRRIKYLYSPKGLAYKEYLHYIKEFFPSVYWSEAFKLWLKTLCPFIWRWLKK